MDKVSWSVLLTRKPLYVKQCIKFVWFSGIMWHDNLIFIYKKHHKHANAATHTWKVNLIRPQIQNIKTEDMFPTDAFWLTVFLIHKWLWFAFFMRRKPIVKTAFEILTILLLALLIAIISIHTIIWTKESKDMIICGYRNDFKYKSEVDFRSIAATVPTRVLFWPIMHENFCFITKSAP